MITCLAKRFSPGYFGRSTEPTILFRRAARSFRPDPQKVTPEGCQRFPTILGEKLPRSPLLALGKTIWRGAHSGPMKVFFPSIWVILRRVLPGEAVKKFKSRRQQAVLLSRGRQRFTCQNRRDIRQVKRGHLGSAKERGQIRANPLKYHMISICPPA
jgi:hypothetical protein